MDARKLAAVEQEAGRVAHAHDALRAAGCPLGLAMRLVELLVINPTPKALRAFPELLEIIGR